MDGHEAVIPKDEAYISLFFGIRGMKKEIYYIWSKELQVYTRYFWNTPVKSAY